MARADKIEMKTERLVGKDYKDGLDDLSKKTVVRLTDIDEKVIKFLDFLQHNGGRGKEACQYLKQALEGLTREHVSNWRAYVYTLLRQFDEEAYKAMKLSEGRKARAPRAPRGEKQPSQDKEKNKFPVRPFDFNPDAPEFVPGKLWSPRGEEGAAAAAVDLAAVAAVAAQPGADAEKSKAKEEAA